MFKESTEEIATRLRDQLTCVRKEFHTITATIHARLRDLIMLMLDGTNKSEDDNTAMRLTSGAKQDAQVATQQLIMEWAAKWRMGDDIEIGTTAMETAIPDIYYDEFEELDDSDDNGPAPGDKAYKDFLDRDGDEDDLD